MGGALTCSGHAKNAPELVRRAVCRSLVRCTPSDAAATPCEMAETAGICREGVMMKHSVRFPASPPSETGSPSPERRAIPVHGSADVSSQIMKNRSGLGGGREPQLGPNRRRGRRSTTPVSPAAGGESLLLAASGGSTWPTRGSWTNRTTRTRTTPRATCGCRDHGAPVRCRGESRFPEVWS